MSATFDNKYFERYLGRNLAGMHRGSRPFLYSFWLRNLRKLIRSQARVLEVGCGLGFLTSQLTRRFSAVALDISFVALSYVRQRWKLRSLTCGDAAALPYRGEVFDAIIAFDVIEHLASPETFLVEACRVLRNRGVLILTTPNPESFGARLKVKHHPNCCDNVWYGHRDETHVSIRRIDHWRRTFAERDLEVLRDGTDFLWDTPYFKLVPDIFQRLFFHGTQWLGTWLFGFLPWRLGENYVAILRKT